jgi:exonuclease III
VTVLLGGRLANGCDASIEFSDSDAPDDDDAGGRGRVLRVGWTDEGSGERWALIGVYAPNGDTERRAFFAADGPLARALTTGPPGANLVVAGDFNCITEAADSAAPAAAAEDAAGGAVALRGLFFPSESLHSRQGLCV